MTKGQANMILVLLTVLVIVQIMTGLVVGNVQRNIWQLKAKIVWDVGPGSYQDLKD